jgi:PleD family two-component response regulator
VLGIIEKHHGNIFVDSEGLGKGSMFVVELPIFLVQRAKKALEESEIIKDVDIFIERANTKETPLVASSNVQLLEEGNLNSKHLNAAVCTSNTTSSLSLLENTKDSVDHAKILPNKILVVDDATSNRKMLIRILQRKGNFIFFEAENGQEAVNVFIKEKSNDPEAG